MGKIIFSLRGAIKGPFVRCRPRGFILLIKAKRTVFERNHFPSGTHMQKAKSSSGVSVENLLLFSEKSNSLLNIAIILIVVRVALDLRDVLFQSRIQM